MQAFFARIYMLLIVGGFLWALSIKADWHTDLVDAIKSEQEAKALRIIEQHKNQIRTAPFANELFKNTLLHQAASEGLTNVVNALLDAGANIQALNDLGTLPIRLAVYGGHVDTAQALIERGRRQGIDFINHRDPEDGYTLLHTAVSSMNPEMVRYILDQGIDRHTTANNGVTPLHVAQEHARGPNQHPQALEIINILENYQPNRVQAAPQGRVNLVQDAQRHFQATQQQQASTGPLARLANWWRGGGSN